MINQLHFLRPEWFYSFIPLILILVAMLQRHHTSLGWKTVCDDKLLPHVLTHSGNRGGRLPLWISAIAASLCIIAAAGPAWKKLPQPVFREQSALVIILDLSRSMDATDIKPSRLERAKLKILDILESRKGGQTALIVYAANAFVVTPLTDDTETIANLVPTLETGLMPAQGSQFVSAGEKAEQLLTQSGVNEGEILLITDGLSENDTGLAHTLSNRGHRLSILGVGTRDGSPIPMSGGFLQDEHGAIVIPKLQVQRLAATAAAGNGIFKILQTDDSDVLGLTNYFSSRKVNKEAEATELTADTWQEEGPWLLIFVIPLAALWARKGWLLMFPVLVSSSLIFAPRSAYAIDTEHLWRTADQQAMQAFKKGDAATAAELFTHDQWKSSAYYRAENYEQAIKSLPEPSDSDDFYNKGNALAKLGRYEEAINAYDRALELDKNNEDASFNKKLVEQALEKQQSQQGDNRDGRKSDQENSPESEKEKSPADSSQAQQNQQENNASDTNQTDANNNPSGAPDQASEQHEDKPLSEEDRQKLLEQLSSNGEADKDREQDENKDNSETNEPVAMQDKELTEDEQATEQWLKRIPDDPGGLLRRKFLYQYKNSPQQPDRQPW